MSDGAGSADAGEVYLDQLGTVRAAFDAGPLTVLAVGLPERARQRLADLGDHRILDDVEQVAEADLVVVSTRLPRGELSAVLHAVRGRLAGPLVALVHTGGEGLAVEVMRQGGAGIVAEGNEEALPALVAGREHDDSLVDVFERQILQAGGGADSARDHDPVTGLPGRGAFEQRLRELQRSGDVPRLVLLRLLNLGSRNRRNDRAATALVRRRLSVQFTPLVRAYDAELFSIDDLEFAIVGESLSPVAAEQLGRRLAAVAGMFAPSGQAALGLAAGHAGSEVSQELATLRELAQRALEVAAVEKGGAVVSADTLSLGVSSTTELEAATRVCAYVEEHDPYPPGHGARVAELAAALAVQLGYEGATLTRIRLAALLHDIGKASLPREAIGAIDDSDPATADLYRSHPELGAAYVRVSGGAEVAEAVAGHHEHWDGSGFPKGLSGEEIPVAARIVAVADAYDRALHGIGFDEPLLPEAAATRLRELAGSRLDPTLVDAALELLAGAGGGRDVLVASAG